MPIVDWNQEDGKDQHQTKTNMRDINGDVACISDDVLGRNQMKVNTHTYKCATETSENKGIDQGSVFLRRQGRASCQ